MHAESDEEQAAPAHQQHHSANAMGTEDDMYSRDDGASLRSEATHTSYSGRSDRGSSASQSLKLPSASRRMEAPLDGEGGQEEGGGEEGVMEEGRGEPQHRGQRNRPPAIW